MPFHEFAKSAILGSRRFYKGGVARIINVFAPGAARNASHWTACRVLGRLLSSQKASSAHGEGFVPTRVPLREYRDSFGSADDFVETCDRLLQVGLLESEPPRSASIAATDALRIASTGAYYWSFLVRSFAYLDLGLADTPLLEDDLAKELADLCDKNKGDYALRSFIRLSIKR